MTEKKQSKLSLTEYTKEQKRKDCPVCKLPDEVLEQLREASSRKIHRRLQLLWLNEELGISISNSQLDTHYSGRHNVA